MKKIVFILLSIFLFILNNKISAFSPEKRVETTIKYAVINSNNVEVKFDPEFNAETKMTLGIGQKVEVMFRSPDKEKYKNLNDYWYEISFQYKTGQYSCFWVYGGFLDKKHTYNPPWNIIYGVFKNKKLDEDEMKNLFPLYAYSLNKKLPVYRKADLREIILDNHDNRYDKKLKIVGRLEKGYDIWCIYSLGIDYIIGKGEIFKFEGSLNNYPEITSGYIKAEDIVIPSENFTSPLGKFKFVKNVMGCWWYQSSASYIDLSFIWLNINNYDFKLLGVSRMDFKYEKPFEYSPNEKYLFCNLCNFKNKVHSAIYDKDGKILAASNLYLVSPTWIDDNIVILRGGTERDRIYKANLNSGKIEEIFKLDGEYQQPNIIEMVPRWDPVIYNSEKKTIKAVFSRPPGGYSKTRGKLWHTAVIVTLDLSGNLIKKETEKRFY